MTRDERIAHAADRMLDAIRIMQTPGRWQQKIQGVIDAADEYDLAMSDTAAEATDTPAVCRRCQQEINEGHDRG